MYSTIFSKSVLKTKKQNKIKLLFLTLERIIKNNYKLFFCCSLLAIITAIINFNIGANSRTALLSKEKSLTEQTIKELDEIKEDKIEKAKIIAILEKKLTEIDPEKDKQKQEVKDKIIAELKKKSFSLSKSEIKKIISDAGIGDRKVLEKNDFEFEFNFFGWRWFKRDDLLIWEFITRLLLLVFVVKSIFSLLHYYLMSYAYDSVERDLKKDLFAHFIRAKYTNSSEVSRNLITQFSSDLDAIAYDIWFIPNRLIYVIFSIFFVFCFDFNFGSGGKINWPFLSIALALFGILIISEVLLFKKAGKLSLAAKKRLEEDNKMIYERINNLEYIKAVSGEKYEEKKIGKQLNSTFRKNKKSLWYSTMFKAIPNYLIIPNIPTFFLILALTFAPANMKMGSVFLAGNFFLYYFSVRTLNSEVSKIVDALLTLEELSSNLVVVNESAQILNREKITPNLSSLPVKNLPFKNGDISFKNVVFAYPKRPQLDILQNFSFCFLQGKSYGIAGKNGIGKSTITKTTLKLYELKAGQILIGENNVQEIDTTNLHQRICYQTNRPTFFRMSIAENVFYPYPYQVADYPKLVHAAKKVGILEFIQKLPKGFVTELKEGGSDLSEGQKQQITAMRMFIHDYDIYILDEILSNVHPTLKEVVLKNIFSKIKGKTILVIDHHYEIFQYVNYVYKFTGEKLIQLNKEDFVS